jgi:hypothetical protein
MRAPRCLLVLLLPLGAGLVALLPGCSSTHPHENLATGIDREVVHAAMHVPSGMRGGRKLPPVAVAITVVPAPPAAPDADPQPFEFDAAAALGDELAATLAATGIFEDVVALKRAPGTDVALAEKEARGRGASLLIEASFEAPVLVRTEREIAVSMLVWLCGGIPSLWLHNHTYRLDCGVVLRLRDLNTSEVLPDRPLAPAHGQDDLTFFERTSSLPVYLLTNIFPSPFCPVDENKVAHTLASQALAKPVGQFLDQIAEAFKGEVYSFDIQARTEGPKIHVLYPQAGKPLYLLKRTVLLSVLVEAPQGDSVREVRVGGRLVFPVRSAPGQVARRRVPIELKQPVTAGDHVLVEAKDGKGRDSACLIVASRERAEQKAGTR